MRKKILTVAVCLAALSFTACGNKNVQVDSVQNQKTEVDLSGDTSVPVMEEEIPASGITEYKNLEDMEKENGSMILPEVKGYTDTSYFVEDETQTVVYSDKEKGTLSFRKGTNVALSAVDSSYSIVYGGTVNGKSVTYGSRGNENLAGVAIWQDGDYYYKIETMQWQEVTKEEMERLVTDFK